MKLETRSLHPALGVEILNCRVSPDMDAATFATLRHEFEQYSVVLLRNQDLSPKDQEAFTKRFR